MLNISPNVSHGQFYAFYFWSSFFLQFSSYLLSTMSKSTISRHVTLIVKYLEDDVVQNEIFIIINNVEEFDI